MAEIYGWTLPEIDALGDEGRQRVRFMWAVSAIYNEAQQYLDKWQKNQAQSQATLTQLQATRRYER